MPAIEYRPLAGLSLEHSELLREALAEGIVKATVFVEGPKADIEAEAYRQGIMALLNKAEELGIIETTHDSDERHAWVSGCADGYTAVTLVSRGGTDVGTSSVCVADEMLADESYRPYIQHALRRTRDECAADRDAETVWSEEWWAGDITQDPGTAFIRNQMPSRLEWT